MKKLFVSLVAVALVLGSCKLATPVADNGFTALDTLVKAENFIKEVEGKQTALFTLKNDSGMVVKITNYGARVVSVLVPGKDGQFADVNIGYASIDGYLSDDMFLGAIVGRYANRICCAKFKLDNKEFKLATNNGKNSLHGGVKGFDKVVWDALENKDTLTLTYTSADMEEGYPGKLSVTVKYIITNNNELKIQFEATTDKKTIVNICSHSYYNLKGEGNGDILDHLLEIPASTTTPVDSTLIPTGKFDSVKNTSFDFNTATLIGARINDKNEQMKFGGGYDHNYVLTDGSTNLKLAARVTEPVSGRVMEIFSTEPGIQFYCGNFMTGAKTGKSGKKLEFRSGLALEPQHFPDSPNKANFPSVVLEPGKKYISETVVKFSIKK